MLTQCYRCGESAIPKGDTILCMNCGELELSTPIDAGIYRNEKNGYNGILSLLARTYGNRAIVKLEVLHTPLTIEYIKQGRTDGVCFDIKTPTKWLPYENYAVRHTQREFKAATGRKLLYLPEWVLGEMKARPDAYTAHKAIKRRTRTIAERAGLVDHINLTEAAEMLKMTRKDVMVWVQALNISTVTVGKAKARFIALADVQKIERELAENIPTKEAARVLGINESSVTQQLRNGKIEGRRIGKHWYLRKEEVMNYKNRRRLGGRIAPESSTTQSGAILSYGGDPHNEYSTSNK